MRALYDYNAQREDEMSFCKHAIIENVEKWDGGWLQNFLACVACLTLILLFLIRLLYFFFSQTAISFIMY